MIVAKIHARACLKFCCLLHGAHRSEVRDEFLRQMREIQRVHQPALKVRTQDNEIEQPWNICKCKHAHSSAPHRKIASGWLRSMDGVLERFPLPQSNRGSMRNISSSAEAGEKKKQKQVKSEEVNANSSEVKGSGRGSTYIWVRDLDLRTEGGTRLLKVLKSSTPQWIHKFKSCIPLPSFDSSGLHFEKQKLPDTLLARPVIIDFADKYPKGRGATSNNSGCSLGKFTELNKHFRRAGQKYPIKVQEESNARGTFAHLQIKIGDDFMNSLEATFKELQPSETSFMQHITRQFQESQSGNEPLSQLEICDYIRTLVHMIDTWPVQSAADPASQAEWWENDARNNLHESNVEEEKQKNKIIEALLSEIAKGIAAKDLSDNSTLPTEAELREELGSLHQEGLKARAKELGINQNQIDEAEHGIHATTAILELVVSETLNKYQADGIEEADEIQNAYFEDEQRRSAYSLEINERRLQYLADIFNCRDVAQVNISGCAWQHVFLDNEGNKKKEAAAPKPFQTERGFCVESRRLYLEDLLRAAIPIYNIDVADKKCGCFTKSLKEHALADLFHYLLPQYLRRDRIRVHFGSAGADVTLTLEQIQHAVANLRGKYENWSDQDIKVRRTQ